MKIEIVLSIVLLILHIAAAILMGVCAVKTTIMISEIFYILSSGLWCMCIGMDIYKLIDLL